MQILYYGLCDSIFSSDNSFSLSNVSLPTSKLKNLGNYFNSNNFLNKENISKQVSKWSGVEDLGKGIAEFRNGNYKSGLTFASIATARAVSVGLVTTLVAQQLFYLNVATDYLSENHDYQNDICQHPHFNYICEGNLSIPRISMPQVEGEAKEQFLNLVSGYTETLKFAARQLVPTQSEMNYTKVMSIFKDATAKVFDPCAAPILVAQNATGEQFVVDGHHRYAACRLMDGMQTIINIKMNINEVLSMLDTFPGVTKAKL